VSAQSSKKTITHLVEQSMIGDATSRDELVERCLPRVYKTVYLTSGGSNEVEDLVQTAVIQLLRDLHRIREPARFFAWLDRVTVNVVRQHFRKRYLKSLVPFSDAIESFADGGSGPDSAFEGDRVLGRLRHHLAGLRPKNRVAVVLSLVQGHTVKEISVLEGCTVETAKKRLFRGRKQLVERLQKDPYCRQMIKEIVK
jgi:RNA polymerase sigma-70 factor, ECF subfamily